MSQIPNTIETTKRPMGLFCRYAIPLLVLLIGPLTSTNGLARDEIAIHGFVSQGYLKSTGNNYLAKSMRGSWEFAEVGINFGTNVSDDMRIGIQLFTRDLGELGNFNFEFDWGFADYTWYDEISFRLGRIKMPYGLYGEYRDLDIVRPGVLMPQSVYFESLRDLLVAFNGLQIYGTIDVGSSGFGSIDYSLFGGSIMGPGSGEKSSTALFFNNRAYEQSRSTPLFRTRNDSVNPWMAGASLAWATPVQGLLLKFTMSHYYANIKADLNPLFIEQLSQIGQLPEYIDPVQSYHSMVNFSVGSLEYTIGEFIFAYEYARYYGEFQSLNAPLLPHTDLNQERSYAQVSYRINDSIQVSSYYGYQRDPRKIYSPFPDLFLGQTKQDKILPEGTLDFQWFAHDYSAAIRLDINDYWIVKLEGHYFNGTTHLYVVMNPNKERLVQHWSLIAAKTTLMF